MQRLFFFPAPCAQTVGISFREVFGVSSGQGELIGCKLLYCHTQSFQKESAGPHLKNRDVNTYKEKMSQFGAV